jgi:hypothetical protein
MAFNDTAWGQLSEVPGSGLGNPIDPALKWKGYQSSPEIYLRRRVPSEGASA